MMKAKEMKDKSVEELNAILLEVQNELFATRNSMKQSKPADALNNIKKLKKTIARLLTTIREKHLAQQKS